MHIIPYGGKVVEGNREKTPILDPLGLTPRGCSQSFNTVGL